MKMQEGRKYKCKICHREYLCVRALHGALIYVRTGRDEYSPTSPRGFNGRPMHYIVKQHRHQNCQLEET